MSTSALYRTMLDRATLCVAGDHDPKLGLVQPIHTSTAYYYLEEGPQPYPRYFNTPNQDAIAKRIAELENAEAGVVFCSGMAAISTCVMSLVAPGDHVLLLRGLYGGTHSFLVAEFTKWGVEFDFVSADIDDFAAKCRDTTKLAFVESPTNPCLDILDLRAMAEFASERGILTIIDNTFASPINQNPIDFGFDVVVHSGTKYLGGHSDLSCGAVVGRSELVDEVRGLARKYGGTLNPIVCHLLERSIKTLDVRVQRQNENAFAVAEFLESHDAVTKVLYPGLSSHRRHVLAASQMRGFGGMVSFELHADASLRDLLTSLKLITPAMSLGGVESTISVPVFTSHKQMSEEERQQSGVTRNLLRFSTGIENKDDLIADFTQAFANCHVVGAGGPMKTFIVDSFTDVPFKGNPAGVCLIDSEPTDEMMLQIAEELGLSETAFVRQVDRSAIFRIRYFSQKMEIPLCGHATLAAARVLFDSTESGELHFITGQKLDLPVRRIDDKIVMEFPVYGTKPCEVPSELLAALGLQDARNAVFNEETRILLLEIGSTALLAKLTPDFAALYRSHQSINGVLVTARSGHDGFDFHSRYFWPWSGTNEDPVTGATHTFLAPYWSVRLGKSKLKSFQSSARGGYMGIELLDDKMLISSQAVIIFEGKLICGKTTIGG